MKNYKFWLVWGENKHVPTVKHENKEKATTEAERLTLVNPGGIFYVLEAISMSRTENVKTYPMDDVPF